MQAIIDVIGALAIGGLILITMLTTLFNVQFTSHDIARSVLLYDNVQKSCELFHSVLATVALNMPVDSVFIRTEATRFTFYSKWNILHDRLDTFPHQYDIFLEHRDSESGSLLRCRQNGNETNFLDMIMWLDELHFTYLDGSDNVTNSPFLIKNIQVDLSFRRTASAMDRNDLNTNITLWSYLKNISIK
jgi:hypothetical protein